MNIFVHPGGHSVSNHGDTAMLLVALNRLTEMLPDASISLINKDVEFFADRYKRITFVNPRDRRAFFAGLIPPRFVPSNLSARVVQWERRAAVTSPSLWSSVASLKARLGQRGNPQRYLRALQNSQVLIVTGQGGINDSFEHAWTILEEIEIALASGLKVYLFGQGIGPLNNPALRKRVSQVLPHVTRICLREERKGLPLLLELGVPPSKIVVTGDDAIELAFRQTPAAMGSGIGANLRIAEYSKLDESVAGQLGQSIRAAAGKVGATVHPIPISRLAHEDDLKWTYRLVMDKDMSPDNAGFDTPEGVIGHASHCRTVVTASYHGAVFALSQGIPVVGLSKSPYYDDKFLGLADQFGTGCEVVRVNAELSPEVLISAIEELWNRADHYRPQLLEAAGRQIRASRAAYEQMAVDVRGLG